MAAVAGYAAGHVHGGLVFTRSGVLVMLAIAGAAVVGAFDDWIKVSNERNLGLSKRAKMGGLLLVATGFAVGCVAWTDVETTLSFTRWSEPGWQLTDAGWVVFAVLLIAGTTNAVNLTDGLDGLAAGSSIYAFITMTVVAFWAFRHEAVYEVNHALDLAVIAAARSGHHASLWNAPRRRSSWATRFARIGAGATGAELNVQLLCPSSGRSSSSSAVDRPCRQLPVFGRGCPHGPGAPHFGSALPEHRDHPVPGSLRSFRRSRSALLRRFDLGRRPMIRAPSPSRRSHGRGGTSASDAAPRPRGRD